VSHRFEQIAARSVHLCERDEGAPQVVAAPLPELQQISALQGARKPMGASTSGIVAK